jgi:hypothetical protein
MAFRRRISYLSNLHIEIYRGEFIEQLVQGSSARGINDADSFTI